jgi:hypothetical protein
MSSSERQDEAPLGGELAELARLADGTLSPARRAALEARVADSPELAAALDEQRRAIEMLDAAAVPAPARLRQRVEAERRRTAPAQRRRRLGFGAGLAVAAAAATLAVLFLLPSSVPGGTVIAEAAELQALPSTGPPPRPAGRTLLAKEAFGVQFPRYRAKFDWVTSGQRSDTVRGRDQATVFYTKGGRRIGYSVLSGDLLDPPDDALTATVEGTRLFSFDEGGRTIVTWARSGRTCVLSGVGVPRQELLDLAGWKGMGTVPF